MDRGRRYTRTPMARRRFNVRLVLVAVLAIGLAVGLIGLSLYFIQSALNRTEQAQLAAAHREGLQQELTLAPSVEPLTASATATPHISGVAQAQASTSTDAQVEPFFQVIGVTRKAFKPIVKRNADAIGWLTIEGIVSIPKTPDVEGCPVPV